MKGTIRNMKQKKATYKPFIEVERLDIDVGIYCHKGHSITFWENLNHQ